jgi:hypothetical protein
MNYPPRRAKKLPKIRYLSAVKRLVLLEAAPYRLKGGAKYLAPRFTWGFAAKEINDGEKNDYTNAQKYK